MTRSKRTKAAAVGAPGRAGARKPASHEVLAHEHHRLAHELAVHQLELEMQNRSLHESQVVAEESRARYAELYDYAPVGHLTLDRAGTIHELNVTTAALLGRDRSALVGRPLRLYVSQETRDRLGAHLHLASRARRPRTVELTLTSPGGGRRVVDLVSIAAPEHSTSAAVLYSAMVDASARRRDDDQRDELLKREQEARLRAEELNRVKQEFLSLVSHELRSPLAPMTLWVRALRAGGGGETLRERAVEALETCIAVQVAMIDDLIDVARGAQGTLRVDREPMDLGPVVSSVVEALRPAATVKQIELAVDLDSAPVRVNGDPTRLRQVVTHLLSNAIDFTREGGHVAISLRRRGPTVELGVRDDGRGLNAEQLAQVFEPFQRGGARGTTGRTGLGTGLAVVKHLVERHDGRVAAESAGEGRGACFTVTLPVL